METIQLLGSTLGLAFASGINLYASVLFVGFGIRFGILQLPSELSSLSVLSHQNVLIVAGILYIVEFIADKIPWVDSLWDSFHTVIRPLGAALIGISAISNMDPAAKALVFLLCGGVALSSHSTKAGTRLAINHSPEPLSNIGMSLFEDLLAAGSSWLALMHPMLMFGIVLAFLSVFALLAPKFYRLLRVETQAFLALLSGFFSSTADSENPSLFDAPPEKFERFLSHQTPAKDGDFCIRCVTGKGAEAGKNYMGYLCLSDNELFFLTRKYWRPANTIWKYSGMMSWNMRRVCC